MKFAILILIVLVTHSFAKSAIRIIGEVNGDDNSHKQLRSVRVDSICTLTIPRDAVVKCGDDIGPDTLGFATASPANMSSTITYIDTIEERFCTGPGELIREINRRWSCGIESKDHNNDGKQSIGSDTVQRIYVRDASKPPQLAPPKQAAASCTDPIDAVNTGFPEVIQSCTDVVMNYEDTGGAVTCDPLTCNPHRVFFRTFRASDKCGNEAPPIVQTVYRDVCDDATVNFCKSSCSWTPATPSPYPIIGVGEIGMGYNAFSGKSNEKSVFSLNDMSFNDGKLFQLFANQTEVTFVVPDQMHVFVVPNIGIQSYSFSRLSDFVAMEATSMGIEMKVTAYKASLGLNTEIQAIGQRMSSGRSHFLLAQEYSNLYSIALEPFSLTLDRVFQDRVRSLPAVYNKSNIAAFESFLNDYGTHVTIEATMGGRVRFQSFASQSEAQEMSALNTKMHISLGLLGKKFVDVGADGWQGSSKTIKEVKPFASQSTPLLFGGDYSISTKQNGWFERWVTTVYKAPVVTRRRVEPLTTYIATLNPTGANSYFEFLTDYSATNQMTLASVPSLPILFSWCDQPKSCNHDPLIQCPSDAPLTTCQVYDDTRYGKQYLMSSSISKGYQMCTQWVSELGSRAFKTQPVGISSPPRTLRSQDSSDRPYYRHARINTDATATKAIVPGLDQLGVGFDALSGTHRLPVFDWTFVLAREWRDSILEKDYALPDQVQLKELFSSKAVQVNIFYSSSEYAQSLAEQSGISLAIPGIFSLSYQHQFTSQFYYGAESILGVANKDYEYFSLEISDISQTQLSSALKYHVSKLPVQYDKNAYFTFIRFFGTHVVTQAYYGGNAHLWTAINRQQYASETNDSMAASMKAHYGLFEAGVSYGTDSSSATIQFSKNSFSWLTLGGGIGSQVLTNEWSSWIKSTKIRPIQLSRKTVTLDSVVSRIDLSIAANVKRAISDYISEYRNEMNEVMVSKNMKLNSRQSTESKQSLLIGNTESCYWSYIGGFNRDQGQSMQKFSELFSEFYWTPNSANTSSSSNINNPQKITCTSVMSSSKGFSSMTCPINTWMASTSSGPGGKCKTSTPRISTREEKTLSTTPVSCCTYGWYP